LKGAVDRGTDDVVVFQFGGFVLFRVGGGGFSNLTHFIQVGAGIGIPIAGESHERIAGGTFGEGIRAGRIWLVGLGNPVEHERAAWVDGESQPVAELTGKLYRAETEITAWPDDGNGGLVQVFLHVENGALEFTAQEFVAGLVVHVDVVDDAVGLVIYPAFGGERGIFSP